MRAGLARPLRSARVIHACIWLGARLACESSSRGGGAGWRSTGGVHPGRGDARGHVGPHQRENGVMATNHKLNVPDLR